MIALSGRSTAARVVRNSLANYGGNIVGLAAGFFLTPFLVRSLGDTGYGAWILVGSISSYFWLLDFGLGASVTKFVSELKATGDRARLNAVVSSSFALLAIVGIVAFVVSCGVAQMVDRFFVLPEDLVADVQTMIVVTGVALLVSFPLGVFGGALRGYQRYDILNLIVIITTIVNTALSILVVQQGFGLVGLAVVGLVTNLLVGGGRWVCARWVDSELTLSPSLVRIAVLREITNFSAWVFVINLATQVVYRSSPIIIAAILGVALVTPFALANSLIQYLRRLVDPILAVLLPAYAELSAVDDTERVRRLFVGGSRAVGAISLPMVLAMVLLGRPFIDLWVGEGYEQTGLLLVLLAPPLFLSFLVAAGDKLLWAKGKVRVNSYVAIADTVLNLGLSIILTLAIGLPGVALATLISVLTTNGLWLMPYICREAGLPARDYLTRVLLPIFVPAVPATAVVLLLAPVFGVGGYMPLALLGACCAASYWGTYLALNARTETFALLASLRSRLVGRRLVADAP